MIRLSAVQRRNILLSFCSVMLLFGLVKAVFANSEQVIFSAEELAWIKANPTVIYGAETNWAPYYFVDQQGQHAGITKDYLDLIGKISHLNFQPSIDNWNALLDKTKAQEIDLLIALYSSKERERFFAFTEPYQTTTDYFFVRDEFSGKSLVDLNDATLAIPKGYIQIETLKQKYPQIKIIETENLFSAVQAVVENRADVLLDSYAVVNYLLRKQAITSIKPFRAFSDNATNSLHMATSNENLILRNIINKSLKAISAKDKRDIVDKWLVVLPAKLRPQLKLNEKEKSWLSQHPKIKVGVEYNWAPYEFLDQSGQLQGFSFEIIKLIEDQLGIEFEYVYEFNWAETLNKVKNKEIDLISGIVSTPQRREYLDFTRPYFAPPRALFVRKENVSILEMADLKGLTLSIENQFSLHETFIRDYPEIKLLPLESTTDALKALSYGEVDAYIGDQGATNWIAEQNVLANLKEVGDVAELGRAEISIGVRLDWPIFKQILNKALLAIPKEDILVSRRKWLGILAETNELSISDEDKSWLNEHQFIRLIGNPNWLPYEVIDGQGNHSGVVAQYLDLISERLGIEVEVVPWDTLESAIQKINNNEVDIISESIGTNVDSSLTYTQDYLISPVVIVMNNHQDYVENIAHIKQKKIALISDHAYVPEVINGYPNIDFYYVKTAQEGLSGVSTGKYDALLATLGQVSYLTTELGLNNVRIVGKTEFNTRLAFGMREEFTPLVAMFNRALDDITQVEKQNVLNTWGNKQYIEKNNYLLLLQIAGILSVIILVIIYWNRRLATEIQHRKSAEAQTQALIDNIPLQIVVTASDGAILTANPKAREDYNISIEDMQKFNIAEFYLNETDRYQIKKEMQEHGQVSEKIVLFKRDGGVVRSMMISIMPIKYNNQHALLSIAIDMTERIQIETKLNEAKEFAESASRAKSEFLSNMSHEIRTPMNAIIGFTELLREQVEDPKHKSFINIIHTAGNTLLTLINDVLDLSKIEAGKFNIEKTDCNLPLLFTEVGNVFLVKLKEKNIDLILDIEPNIPQNILIDATRLRQVLFNLIGNAVKFTEEGYIQVKAYTQNNEDTFSKLDLIIEITDSGLGISENQQQTIFKDFEQSPGQDYSRYGGTGLGLSICKKLVAMMGGKIELKSELGNGSTFIVRLNDVEVLALAFEAESDLLGKPPASVLLACKILVVDDVKDNRDLLVAYFANTNVEIVEAENGLQAVELAAQQFDLILMDIRMPVKDGYQAAREIHEFSKTPIVALTASVMTDEYERLKENNFAGYLRKPVKRELLFMELKKHLPFEELTSAIEPTKPVAAEIINYKNLPRALESIEPLLSHFERCKKHKDISEIRLFCEALQQIMLQHPVQPIIDFAQSLNDSVERFDIGAIEKSLNEYPNLIKQLKSH